MFMVRKGWDMKTLWSVLNVRISPMRLSESTIPGSCADRNPIAEASSGVMKDIGLEAALFALSRRTKGAESTHAAAKTNRAIFGALLSAEMSHFAAKTAMIK